MESQSSSRQKSSGYTLFATIVAVGAITLPMMFGDRITISPLVLFLAAIIPNLFFHQIGASKEKESGVMYSRVFLLRIAASAASAFVILGIYHIAYTLGS